VANGAVKWFNRASGFGLIAPDGGGDDLFVHRASLDESVLATAGERVEFEWRDGGMGQEAINVVAAPSQTPEAALTPGAKRMVEPAGRSEALEALCI
jgi:CspA family cold shock protein